MWDRDIPIGGLFRQTIRTEVERADAVVVTWSRASIASHWVQGEADLAAERGKLLPILLDAVEPPLPLGAIQGADFSEWDGDREAECFQRLIAGVTALGPARQASETTPPIALPHESTRPDPLPLLKPYVVFGLVTAGIICAAWALRGKDERSPSTPAADAPRASGVPSELPVETPHATSNEGSSGAASKPKPVASASATPAAPPKPAKVCCHPSGSLRVCAKARCSDCQLLECVP